MNELTLQNEEALLAAFSSEELGNGFEEVTNDDLKPNFLRIAQSTTDCAKEGHEAYVESFKPGIFYDTTTKTNMGNTVKVVVLGYFTNYCEWGRELGDFRGALNKKQFENIKDNLTQYVDDKSGKTHSSKWVTPEKTYIVETKNFFVFLPDYPDLDILLFNMTGTAIGQSKNWTTKMNNVKLAGKRAPMFLTVWELGLLMDSNESGSWYALGKKSTSKIENLGFLSSELHQDVLSRRAIVAEWINSNKSISYKAADTDTFEDTNEF